MFGLTAWNVIRNSHGRHCLPAAARLAVGKNCIDRLYRQESLKASWNNEAKQNIINFVDGTREHDSVGKK